MGRTIDEDDAINAILREYNKDDSDYPTDYQQGLSAAKKIIEQLPPAQTEIADCIYCHEDSDGYVKPIEKNCHAFIRFGMDGWELSLKAKGWNGSVKIKYCPMCGRSLTQE